MMTRAFLLLLAMMTGLSAAQAAESVRPAQMNAAVMTAHAVDADLGAKRQVVSYAIVPQCEWSVRPDTGHMRVTSIAAPLVPCIQISDRIRV